MIEICNYDYLPKNKNKRSVLKYSTKIIKKKGTIKQLIVSYYFLNLSKTILLKSIMRYYVKICN